MVDIYLYTSLDKISGEAMSEIHGLRGPASGMENRPPAAITVTTGAPRNRLEIRMDVSDLDYETKHEMDIRIRKVLKRHRIKFLFSNVGHTKLNFFSKQTVRV